MVLISWANKRTLDLGFSVCLSACLLIYSSALSYWMATEMILSLPIDWLVNIERNRRRRKTGEYVRSDQRSSAENEILFCSTVEMSFWGTVVRIACRRRCLCVCVCFLSARKILRDCFSFSQADWIRKSCLKTEDFPEETHLNCA